MEVLKCLCMCFVVVGVTAGYLDETDKELRELIFFLSFFLDVVPYALHLSSAVQRGGGSKTGNVPGSFKGTRPGSGGSGLFWYFKNDSSLLDD